MERTEENRKDLDLLCLCLIAIAETPPPPPLDDETREYFRFLPNISAGEKKRMDEIGLKKKKENNDPMKFM